MRRVIQWWSTYILKLKTKAMREKANQNIVDIELDAKK